MYILSYFKIQHIIINKNKLSQNNGVKYARTHTKEKTRVFFFKFILRLFLRISQIFLMVRHFFFLINYVL